MTPANRRPSLATGSQLGRYVVVGELGAGGMGLVVEAHDPALDRKIALKLVRPEQADEAGRLRLLREAQAMARLTHPNVITVHDVGVLDDQVFVAMELVAGTTLKKWIGERRGGWRDALSLLARAGRGLQAAHAAGMIHRDFKPDNVLLGDDGRVVVTDFGLARSAGGADPPPPGDALAVTVTHTGAVIGTPAYMAPEQHQGRDADARSDQFSFCVTSWEAVFGERPFRVDGATDLPDTVALGAEIVDGRVRPPPAEARVPGRLRRALLRGLAVDPAARWPSMAALLGELDAILGAGRRRLAIAGIAAFVVAAGAAIAIAASGSRPAREPVPAVSPCRGFEARLAGVWDDPARAAVREAFSRTGAPFADEASRRVVTTLDRYAAGWVSARTAACEAHQLGEQSAQVLDLRMACYDERRRELDALADLFGATEGRRAVARAPALADGLAELDGCADTVALAAPDAAPRDSATAARVRELRERLAANRALRDGGKLKQSLAEALVLADEARAVGWTPVEAEALHALAATQAKNSQFAEAEQTARRAIDAAERAGDDLVRAGSYSMLVRALGELARYDEAHRVARLADGLVARLAERHPGRAAGLPEMEGNVYYREGKYADAERVHRQSLALRERAVGREHGEYGRALLNVANAVGDGGNLDEGRRLTERGIELIERAWGRFHPLVSHGLNNLATYDILRGDSDGALRALDESLAIKEQIFGPDHSEMAFPLVNKASVLVKRGKAADALPLAERAVAIFEKAHGPDHPFVATALTTKGAILVDLGRPRDAVSALERALAIQKQHATPEAERAETRAQLARAKALPKPRRSR